MANFIKVNKTHPAVSMLISGLKEVRSGEDKIANALAAFNALSDGDRNAAEDFDQLVAECGVSAGDDATAEAAALRLYAETASVGGNLTAGAAAVKQLAGYLGE